MNTFKTMTQDEMEQVNGGNFALRFAWWFVKSTYKIMTMPHGKCTGNDPRYEYNDATRVAR